MSREYLKPVQYTTVPILEATNQYLEATSRIERPSPSLQEGTAAGSPIPISKVE